MAKGRTKTKSIFTNYLRIIQENNTTRKKANPILFSVGFMEMKCFTREQKFEITEHWVSKNAPSVTVMCSVTQYSTVTLLLVSPFHSLVH